MALTNLIPWKWGEEKEVPVKRTDESAYPIERMFDNFFSGFGLSPNTSLFDFGSFQPSIDVSENDQEITVAAELPGLDENDIEVSLSRNVLTISGTKQHEKEEKGKNYYHIERSYGSFHRAIPLSCEVDPDNVEAKFKNGVLTVNLPKPAELRNQTKKITVKHS